MKRGRNDGFTDAQRAWIRARDGNKCVLCGDTEKLEVHHITPFRYAQMVLHWTLERTNVVFNGITLCRYHHRGDENSVHPDAARALRLYHQNKNSFMDMSAQRDALCRQGKEYWLTVHDNTFAEIAARNTLRYVAEGNYPTPWDKEKK